MRLTILRCQFRISPVSAESPELLNIRRWRTATLLIISLWLANGLKLAVSDVSRLRAVLIHDCVLMAFSFVTWSISLEVDVLVRSEERRVGKECPV